MPYFVGLNERNRSPLKLWSRSRWKRAGRRGEVLGRSLRRRIVNCTKSRCTPEIASRIAEKGPRLLSQRFVDTVSKATTSVS